MKLSVSLPDEDVSYLDAYAREQGYESRSAVLHQAVRALRAADLGDAYQDAWDEWEDSDESGLWDATVGDGLAS
jgi:Arc/MetJ-type ribon-helix-helix transcriptional regulator